jgi:hypothetical protein
VIGGIVTGMTALNYGLNTLGGRVEGTGRREQYWNDQGIIEKDNGRRKFYTVAIVW